MKVRMKVEGGDKLARRLQMLAEDVAKTHLRESALMGAEIIRAEVEAKAPRKTGTLAGDIQKSVEKETKSRVTIKVGPGAKGWYSHLVEDGHAVVVNGQKVGDVPPQPFMRPAFDEKIDDAQAAVEVELRRRLKAYER